VVVLDRHIDGEDEGGGRRSVVGPVDVVDVAIGVVPGIGEDVLVNSQTVLSWKASPSPMPGPWTVHLARRRSPAPCFLVDVDGPFSGGEGLVVAEHVEGVKKPEG